MRLFRRAQQPSAKVISAVCDLSREGALNASVRRRELRYLEAAVDEAWRGRGREERLYALWLTARTARSLLLGTSSGPDDWIRSAHLRDRALALARLYERAYGEHIDVDRSDWPLLGERELAQVLGGARPPAPEGMRAPVLSAAEACPA